MICVATYTIGRSKSRTGGSPGRPARSDPVTRHHSAPFLYFEDPCSWGRTEESDVCTASSWYFHNPLGVTCISCAECRCFRSSTLFKRGSGKVTGSTKHCYLCWTSKVNFSRTPHVWRTREPFRDIYSGDTILHQSPQEEGEFSSDDPKSFLSRLLPFSCTVHRLA